MHNWWRCPFKKETQLIKIPKTNYLIYSLCGSWAVAHFSQLIIHSWLRTNYPGQCYRPSVRMVQMWQHLTNHQKPRLTTYHINDNTVSEYIKDRKTCLTKSVNHLIAVSKESPAWKHSFSAKDTTVQMPTQSWWRLSLSVFNSLKFYLFKLNQHCCFLYLAVNI